jgi:hypothetical protein
MSEEKNERDQPLNMNGLRNRLLTLGVCVPKRTLWNWAENELIPSPEKREKRPGLGRGKGRTAWVWPESAIWTAAGVWALRGGSGKNWSRKDLSSDTVKEVQKFAAKVYTHPYVLLSIPYDTRDDHDPPRNDVALSVSVDCSPKIERFIIPYVMATQKARRGWPLNKPALITFRWGNSVSKSQGGAFERPLDEVSLSEAPHAKDEPRFYINGLDVRERLLQDRAFMRDLRQSSPPFFQRLRSLMRKLRENDPHFIELHKGEFLLINVLRSLIRELSKDDPLFHDKLRSLMRALRESENDPQFYEKWGSLITAIRKRDPKLCKKLTLLMRAIGGRDFFFIEKLRLRIPTRMKLSLAIEPTDTKDIGDIYELAQNEKNRKKKAHYVQELRRISKENYRRYQGVKELPTVSWLELQLRRAIASYYLEELKKSSEAKRTHRQKHTDKQKTQSKH